MADQSLQLTYALPEIFTLNMLANILSYKMLVYFGPLLQMGLLHVAWASYI